MLQAITTINTGKHTHYTDVSNKVKEVRHSVVSNDVQRKELEEQIAEELCRVLMHKVS